MSNAIHKSVYKPNPPKFTADFFEPETKQPKLTKYSVTFSNMPQKEATALEEQPLTLLLEPEISEPETFPYKTTLLTSSNGDESLSLLQTSLEMTASTGKGFLTLEKEISEAKNLSIEETVFISTYSEDSLSSLETPFEILDSELPISFQDSLLLKNLHEAYQNFMDLCVPLDQYSDSPFGLICENHPEANFPYPGPPPENPHNKHSTFSKFIKRKISKKFRAQERAYKNKLRHWEIQLKNHLSEVPFLQAKDHLFKAYIALAENRPQEAIEYSQEAINHPSSSSQALAIQILAHYELGNVEESTHAKLKYECIQPQNRLNALADNLFEEIFEEHFKESSKNKFNSTLDRLDCSQHKISSKQDSTDTLIHEDIKEFSFSKTPNQDSDFFDRKVKPLLKHLVKESYFVDKELKISSSFSSLHDLFQGVKENLVLINALDKWDEFPAARLLKSSSEISNPKSKQWIERIIEELSFPPSFGETIFRRTFMQNAIKIQTAQKLLEITPKLEVKLNKGSLS